MSVIAKLKAILSVDSTKFDRGLDQSKRNSQKFASAIKSTFKTAALAVTGFVVGASAALGTMTKAALATLDTQAKLAKSLGISNEAFQAMSLVANEAGVEQEALGNAIRKSQVAIQNAERGLMTYARGFDELGLKTSELIGLSPDKQFEKIAIALGTMTDKTNQITLAQELFGRQGLGVINMLDNYSEKIEEARAFNDKFGLSVSRVDTNKIEEANDAWGRVKMSLGGLANVMAVQVAPIITAISNAFIESGVDARKFGDAIAAGMKVGAFAIDQVRRAINGVQLVFNLAVSQIARGVTKASVLIYDLSVGISNAFAQIGVSIPTADKILEVGYAAKVAGDNAEAGFNEAVTAANEFEKTIDKISRIQKEADIRAQGSEKKPTVDIGKESGENVEKTKGKIKVLKKEAKEAEDVFKKAGDSLADSFSEAFKAVSRGENVFKSLGRSILNSIGDALDQSFKKAAGTLFESIGKTIFGGFSLPSNATGNAYVNKDTITRVHKGEAIIPAQQAKNMGSGGGDTINIDARGAEAGVEQKIRNVMNEVQALRKDVPKIAVSSVADTNKRNPRFLNNG